MSEACDVDHNERRAMGLRGCFKCYETLQSIEDANKVRMALGLDSLYGADGILHRRDFDSERKDVLQQLRADLNDVMGQRDDNHHRYETAEDHLRLIATNIGYREGPTTRGQEIWHDALSKHHLPGEACWACEALGSYFEEAR